MNWWKKNFLIAELFLSILLAILVTIWSEYYGRPYIEYILDNNRSSIYSTLAAIFGALLGFVITAASIVLGYSENEKLSVVTNSLYYPQLWGVFVSNIRVLGLATLISLVSLLIASNDTNIGIVVYLNIWILLLVLLRLWRVIWVLENIIGLITSPRKPPDSAP